MHRKRKTSTSTSDIVMCITNWSRHITVCCSMSTNNIILTYLRNRRKFTKEQISSLVPRSIGPYHESKKGSGKLLWTLMIKLSSVWHSTFGPGNCPLIRIACTPKNRMHKHTMTNCRRGIYSQMKKTAKYFKTLHNLADWIQRAKKIVRACCGVSSGFMSP